MWRSHTSLGEVVIIGRANIICRRQTSLKKAQRDCVRLFSWQGREDSVSSLRRKAEFLISALLRSSVFRGSDSPPDCHSLPLPFESSSICIPAKRKSPRKNRGLYLFGRGGRTRTRDPRFWSGFEVSQNLEIARFFARFNALFKQNHVS